MKVIHSKAGVSILLSIDDAKTLYSCAVESNSVLEDWEYEIRIGVKREEVLDLQKQLKQIIIDSGKWGKP